MKLRGVYKKEVIIVRVLEGDGSEDDVFRVVDYYLLNDKNSKLKLIGTSENGLEILDEGDSNKDTHTGI